MQDLIVTLNNVPYGQDVAPANVNLRDVNTLNTGALAFFDGNGLLIDRVAPVIDRNDVFVALGNLTYGPKIVKLDRAGTIEVVKRIYIAPVNKVIRFGTDGVSFYAAPTLTGGEMYTLKVYIQNPDSQHDIILHQFAFSWNPLEFANSGIADEEEFIFTKFGTLMAANAEFTKYVTVAVTAAGANSFIALTSVDFDDFKVEGFSELEYCFQHVFTALVSGENTTLFLKEEIERIAKTHDGITDTNNVYSSFPKDRDGSLILANQSYTVWSITNTKTGFQNRAIHSPDFKVLRICVPGAYANTVDAVDTITAAL